MVAAASVFTALPLRKVFDITCSATGDTGVVVIPHGIDFTDAASSNPALLTEVIAAPFGGTANLGGVPYVTAIDGTNVTMGFNPTIVGGVARVHIQRMHSVQG